MTKKIKYPYRSEKRFVIKSEMCACEDDKTWTDYLFLLTPLSSDVFNDLKLIFLYTYL